MSAPDSNRNWKDMLDRLEARRKKLVEDYTYEKKAAHKQGADAILWGAITGAALLMGGMIVAGVTSVVALMSGGKFLMHRREVKRIHRVLTTMKDRIIHLHEERAQIELDTLKLKDGLKGEFSPAAQKKIRDLESRMQKLQDDLDNIAPPPRKPPQ